MPEIYGMAGHLIRRLNQISVSVFTEHMAALGLELTPIQFAALDILADRPGMDQATLAGTIAYDRVTIGGAIERLERKGLVIRNISSRDRRARELYVSPRGKALLEQLRPEIWHLQDIVLRGLDSAERHQFLQLLQKATEAGNELSRAPLQLQVLPLSPADADGDPD
ncbi:MAG: MarR family transcriptional regulator [Thiothrix sp.]|nr:MarR family transcriptional regulator [Thiothrix sp.]